MKKRITLFLSVLLLTTFSARSAQWMTSLEDAKKMAIVSNKLILVDFWATWCGPCIRMDSESWSKPEVEVLMRNFVSVKIDIDTNRSTSLHYGVRGIPYIFILDPNGKVIYKSLSYKTRSEVVKLLQKYALNTSFLNSEYLEFYENRTSINSIKLAEKYLDYSALIDDDNLKSDFRSLANKYLILSKKKAKKDRKNKKMILQRAKLLSLYSKLLNGKYDKTLEKLKNDFSTDEIISENTSLYNFIYYVGYIKLDDRENAKKWYQELRQSDGYKPYFQKSRKI